jgi:hypothetical protein
MFTFTSTCKDAIQSLKYSVLLHSMLLCNLLTLPIPFPFPPYSHPDHPDRRETGLVLHLSGYSISLLEGLFLPSASCCADARR